jgi:hypothetical protein
MKMGKYRSKKQKTILTKFKIIKMKQPNKVGGGARTNVNGLSFEQTTSLREIFLQKSDFKVIGDDVIRDGKKVGQLCEKNKIYKNILEPQNIEYRRIVSKKLLPDEAILVGDTMYIIEKKFQSGSGSVDEKLQTCDFKKKQYAKLLATVNLKVEYIYFLNDWFLRSEYDDVKEYITEVGCQYYFDELPLSAIGL